MISYKSKLTSNDHYTVMINAKVGQMFRGKWARTLIIVDISEFPYPDDIITYRKSKQNNLQELIDAVIVKTEEINF